mmetsp:Transcript_4647/g.10252  ORF Transcript_4647/g.10252 Transcript_4647/m.10252 type:complete len:828 (+) Transcript_4647:99-2582(+)
MQAGEGIFLPLFGESEQGWPRGLRIALYFMGLIWCFMGVALISDVFMSAIETITSQEKTVTLQVAGTNEKRRFRVGVWNDTVANLTLMALGSSAPEILLSCIELVSNEFYSGTLGPATIVGSASFNLLGISAVCVMAIPNGDTRIIEGTSVYFITASCSLFAYAWLLVILEMSSPDVVDIWEGLLTFLFFPMLVSFAFVADRGWLKSQRSALTKLLYADNEDGVSADMLTAEKLNKLIKEFNAKGEPVPKDLILGLESKTRSAKPGTKSKALRRIEATRQALKKGLVPSPAKHQLQQVETEDENAFLEDTLVFSFDESVYEVMENAGKVVLTVKRTHLEQQATIDYRTEDGIGADAAKVSSQDYDATAGTLVFEPGVESLSIVVPIIDDDQQSDDKNFFVKLHNPRTLPEMKSRVASTGTATVLILNDDFAGRLQWSADEYDARSVDGQIVLKVNRRSGCSGVCGCRIVLRDGASTRAAIRDRDFYALDGDKVEFEHNETSKEVVVRLNSERDATSLGRAVFHAELVDPYGGATFMSHDEHADKLTCDVIIDRMARTQSESKLQLLTQVLAAPVELHRLAAGSVLEQMMEALYCNGSAEAQKDASVADWALHVVNVPWKLVFAFVPPTKYCGGWLTFFFSLLMTGGVTAIVGDMASMLGCVLDLPDEITAITLVALGTSLPDTLASRTAAMQDPNADASIGNVTGSNSVNVFLGLGLPWFIGAIYWRSNAEAEFENWKSHPVGKSTYQERYGDDVKFMVPAGSLAYSVSVFSICGVMCLGLLLLRRKTLGGELGGPSPQKELSAAFLIMLWCIYIGMSSWHTLSTQE